MTKAHQIREYIRLNPNASAVDVAKALGVKRQYVNSIAFLDKKKKTTPPAKRGRPRKEVVTQESPVVTPVAAPSLYQIDRIRKLEQQIVGYRTVISYLEHQLGLKDSQYGAAV